MRRLSLISGLIMLLMIVLSASLIAAQPAPTTPGPLAQVTPTAETQLPEITPEATAEATLESTPESTPAALLEDVTYTVVRGDRLIKIAERYGVSVDCLIRANRLTNPNRILVGQTLLIPVSCQAGQGGGEITTATTATGTTATVTGAGVTGRGVCQFDRYPGRVAPGGVYTIRAGDTLDFIACDFGIALTCLLDSNPQIGANRGRIHAGDGITINLACPGWDGAVIP